MSLPDQYSMSFLGIDSEVLYILVYIKPHIVNDMDKDHYVCYVLDYNTGTWWNCDDDTITQYPGYPLNVYDELLTDKKEKENFKIFCMDGSYRIVSMVYSKKDIISSSTYSFITGNSVSKENEHIKESIADFETFKEEVGMNKMICNNIQTSISLWKED